MFSYNDFVNQYSWVLDNVKMCSDENKREYFETVRYLNTSIIVLTLCHGASTLLFTLRIYSFLIHCFIVAGVFEPFLKKYLEKYQYQTVTTDDWKECLEEHFHDKVMTKCLLEPLNFVNYSKFKGNRIQQPAF